MIEESTFLDIVCEALDAFEKVLIKSTPYDFALSDQFRQIIEVTIQHRLPEIIQRIEEARRLLGYEEIKLLGWDGIND